MSSASACLIRSCIAPGGYAGVWVAGPSRPDGRIRRAQHRARGRDLDRLRLNSAMARSTRKSFWTLVRRQHGCITHQQMRTLGFSAEAIQHRLETGRLHPIYRGVYAVGRRELSQRGRWMAAVLACGGPSALSDTSAAQLWRIRPEDPDADIHVSTLGRSSSRGGLVVHHRSELNV